MELFAIHCTTCKARLIVKDESVIGDILACPKCNSMVQVVPPVGWKRPGGGSSAAELPAAIPPASQTPTKAPAPTPPKKAAVAIPPALPAKTAASPVTAVSPHSDANSPGPAPAEVALALSATGARRDWLVLGGGLLGGVVLGAAVWLVASMRSSPPEIVAEAPANVAPAASQEPVPTAIESPQPDRPEPPAGEQSAPAPADAAHREVAPIAAPVEAPSATVSAESDGAEDAAKGAEKPAHAEAEPDVAPKNPAPSLKLEPIPSSAAREPSDIDAFLTPPTSVPSEGNSLFDEPAKPDPEPAGDTSDVPDPALPPEPTGLSAEEIDDRLSVSLSAVEFAGVSLAQFATFVADVSGVAVVLDEAALAKAGKQRRTSVTVKLTDTTAGEALRAAVESVGLSWVARDGKIVVTANQP